MKTATAQSLKEKIKMFNKRFKLFAKEEVALTLTEMFKHDLYIRRIENENYEVCVVKPLWKKLQRLRANTWDQDAITQMQNILVNTYMANRANINREYKKLEEVQNDKN